MEIKKPSDCTPQELEAFEALVLEGKQVDGNNLMKRLKSCKALAFYYVKGELAGVSAIKQKGQQMVKVTMNKAGVDKKEVPGLELGYAYTKPAFRGQRINTELNDGLLAIVDGELVYATTDNDAMRHYLRKKGFQKLGNSFKGNFNANLDYFERG